MHVILTLEGRVRSLGWERIPATMLAVQEGGVARVASLTTTWSCIGIGLVFSYLPNLTLCSRACSPEECRWVTNFQSDIA